MNKDKILAVADAIENDPTHDQETFFHTCGTPSCIAGWACHLDGWVPSSSSGVLVCKGTKEGATSSIASKILDFGKDAQNFFFYVFKAESGKETAGLLRKLVKLGEKAFWEGNYR